MEWFWHSSRWRVSAGAVAYAFLFNNMANEKNVEKRLETIKKADTDRMAVKAGATGSPKRPSAANPCRIR